MGATGSGPEVRMNEASALSLAGVDSKENKIESHAARKFLFPAMASIKVVREEKKGSGSKNEVSGA